MPYGESSVKNTGKPVTDEIRKKIDETEETLNKVFEEISRKVLSKYAFKENRVISKGRSIFDVAQEKLIELWKRSIKPQADVREDLKWIDRNINQGERKLYKYPDQTASLDDEALHPGCFAEESEKQGKLEKYQIIEKVFKTYEPRDRSIIELRLFAQMSYEEIAEITDTTKGNARKIVCDFKKDCIKFGIKNS